MTYQEFLGFYVYWCLLLLVQRGSVIPAPSGKTNRSPQFKASTITEEIDKVFDDGTGKCCELYS